MIAFYIFQSNFLINSVITFDLPKVQKNQTPFWKREIQENLVQDLKSNRTVFFLTTNHAAFFQLFHSDQVCALEERHSLAEHRQSSRDSTNARKEPCVNEMFFS